VTVVSSFPLGEIIQCREASGRIAKWVVEIMGNTISFAPRKAIKSQVLADFVAEWVDTQLPTALIQPELWTMFFELGVRRLDTRGDSQLVIDQVMKNSHCRDPKMEAYCDEVWRLEDKFYGLELNHIA
jgi:hypothetical protein